MELLPILLPIGFILLFIGLMVGLYLYHSKKEKERTLAMQQAAQLMGWAFQPESHLGMIPYAGAFNLFNQGHSKNVRNMIYGQIEGAKAAIFDYRYTVGSGKNSHTYNQSVLYFETPKLQLPQFTLGPENFMHRIGSVFGYQDIDFGHRPEFSKRYLLRGQDEQAIRAAFTDHVLAFYEANQGLQTEGGGNQIFIYRQGHRVPPVQIAQYVQWASSNILNLFKRPW